MTADERAWVGSLAGGVVVAGAVWGLLEGLRRSALDVERAVDDVWTAGKRLAQNTSTTHALQATKERGLDLLAELERHRENLEASPP